MLLHLATWPEVEASLASHRGIIVPIGSTEQHGPTGLIGTDAITAEAFAHALGERVRAYVGPTVAIGMAQHHLAFAGTISLRPSTLMAVVVDILQSLARHGFDRAYFVNGHGGNISAVEAAFSEFHASGSFGNEAGAMRTRLVNWWDAPGAHRLAREAFGEADGVHATASEISITQFVQPGSARHIRCTPTVAAPLKPFAGANDYRSSYPDGRIGSDPALADPEIGNRLFDAALEHLEADYATFAGLRPTMPA